MLFFSVLFFSCLVLVARFGGYGCYYLGAVALLKWGCWVEFKSGVPVREVVDMVRYLAPEEGLETPLTSHISARPRGISASRLSVPFWSRDGLKGLR